MSSLMDLVRTGQVDGFSALLHHLDEEGKQNELAPALILAAQRGHDKIVALILESGVSVDYVDVYGLSALMWASCRGHEQTVKHLLAAKADVNKIARRVMVVQSLKFASPSKMISRTTSLLLAATHGHANIVEQLIKAGANLEVVGTGNAPPSGMHDEGKEEDNSSSSPHPSLLDAVGGTGESTALFFAARNNHLKVAEILLNHGAIVDAVSRSQETPLHKASHKGHCEMVELLLKMGADVRSVDTTRSSSLHKACAEGYRDVVDLLIAKDADINARDDKKDTPFHHAVCFGHKQLVGRLLSTAKVELDARNENLETPLLTAIHRGQGDLEGHLDLDLIRLLIRNGASVNIKNRQEETPLHICVTSGSIDLLRLLLDAGADPCERDKRGCTPCDKAKLSHGNTEMVEILAVAERKMENERAMAKPLSPGKGVFFLRQVMAQAQINDEIAISSYTDRMLSLGYHSAHALRRLVEQERPDAVGRRLGLTKVVHRNRFIQEAKRLVLPELDLEKPLYQFLALLLCLDESIAREYADPIREVLGCEKGSDLLMVDYENDIVPLGIQMLEGHVMGLVMFFDQCKNRDEDSAVITMTSPHTSGAMVGFLGRRGSTGGIPDLYAQQQQHHHHHNYQESQQQLTRGTSEPLASSMVDMLSLPEHSSFQHAPGPEGVEEQGEHQHQQVQHRRASSPTFSIGNGGRVSLTKIPWPQAELHWAQIMLSLDIVDENPDPAARAGLIRLEKIIQSLWLENKYATLSTWSELTIAKTLAASSKGGGGIGVYMNELRKKCSLSVEDYKIFDELERYRLLRNHFAHDDGLSFKPGKAREVLVFAARMLLDWAATDVPDDIRKTYQRLIASSATREGAAESSKASSTSTPKDEEKQEPGNGATTSFTTTVVAASPPTATTKKSRSPQRTPPHGSGLVVSTINAGSGLSQSMVLPQQPSGEPTHQTDGISFAKTAPSRSPVHRLANNSNSSDSDSQKDQVSADTK